MTKTLIDMIKRWMCFYYCPAFWLQRCGRAEETGSSTSQVRSTQQCGCLIRPSVRIHQGHRKERCCGPQTPASSAEQTAPLASARPEELSSNFRWRSGAASAASFPASFHGRIAGGPAAFQGKRPAGSRTTGQVSSGSRRHRSRTSANVSQSDQGKFLYFRTWPEMGCG